MNKDKTKEKRAGFTPGPWHCGQGNGQGNIFANNGRMTCEKGVTVLHPICHMLNSFKECEDKANARLIASAPELYEQARLFERALASGDLSATHDGLRNCDMLAQVREVLAKVDGRAEG